MPSVIYLENKISPEKSIMYICLLFNWTRIMQSGLHSRRCTQVFHLNHLLASPPVLTQGFSILSNYLCSPHTEASFSGIGLEGKIYTQIIPCVSDKLVSKGYMYNPVPHCGASVTWSWTEQITLFHQVCFRSQSGFCWFQWRAFFQVAKTLMFQIHESSQDGWWRLGSLWVHFQPWNGNATTAFAVKKLTGTYLESVRLKLTT